MEQFEADLILRDDPCCFVAIEILFTNSRSWSGTSSPSVAPKISQMQSVSGSVVYCDCYSWYFEENDKTCRSTFPEVVIGF